MSSFFDFLLIIIPSLFIFIGAYFLMKVYFKKQLDQKKIELGNMAKTTTPLRLQAYERMTLFLERIAPNHLLLRTYESASKVNDFQALLLKEIREEYNHNLAQQIYLSAEVWDEIKMAMNEMAALINQSAAELGPNEEALQLSKKVFEKVVSENIDPTEKALTLLKKEVRAFFA